MWLLEYVYFQSFKWMLRQGRDDAVEMSRGPLTVSLILYVLGFIPLIDRWFGVSLNLMIAEIWPKFSDPGKFLKPSHALALLVGIAVFFLVAKRFHRPEMRNMIMQRFSTAKLQETKNGGLVVMAFYISSIAFAVSMVFAFYPLALLIVAALAIGNVLVYRKYYAKN